MNAEMKRVLVTEAEISARVAELGEQIATDLSRDLAAEGAGPDAPDRVVVVPILMGAVVFVADLIRRIPIKMRMGTVAVSSYPGATMASKGPAIRSAMPPDLTGRHVLIIDDILDTGQTLGFVRSLVEEQRPASVRVCVLLSKDRRRAVDVAVEYVGFEIPDEFVVGYGLDYDGYYRNVPAIGVLSEDAL